MLDPRSIPCRPALSGLHGFSLLEVLVTLVVVAIGLLGVAGMQVTSIKLNRVAETRSNGTVYATDIIERMRANPGNVASYATDFSTTHSSDTTQAERDLKQWKANLSGIL
jgi:type IV pilus modification protein PilV